jgi:aryl-phospho-beta-D-glucosidase BglC (GH1 family)
MRTANITALTLFVIAPLGWGAITDEDFIRAKGHRLVDRSGDPVHLRGVNIGGWLLFEPWMCPMDSSGLKDDHSAREVLAERFGNETAAQLLRVYQENWFTAADLDRIAALGMNVIRVPFWYRNLQTEEGAWLRDGFDRLDWVVAEAGKRDIHVILDLHGVPGGQTKGESTGRVRERAGFWHERAHLDRTAGIWRRIAERYRGNPAVAAYDLINEPSDAPTLGALWSAYDRLYREIRAVDPDHVITVEGCINTRVGDRGIHWGWEALPHPDVFGWTNVLYQMHHYEWDWDDLAKQNRGVDFQVAEWEKHRAYGVPGFIGEFNPMAREEAWNHALHRYSRAGLHWAFWSYKATHGTGSDSWGIYNPVTRNSPDLRRDDAATIRAKWRATATDRSYALNPMLERVLKTALVQPAPTASSKP